MKGVPVQEKKACQTNENEPTKKEKVSTKTFKPEEGMEVKQRVV